MKYLALLIVSLVCFAGNVAALEVAQQQRFDQVMKMTMADLTFNTKKLLADKYPTQPWRQYRFPKFVSSSEGSEMGYRIAVVTPELLGGIKAAEGQGIPCYCSCETFGHRDLLACFLQEGRLEKGFDAHGSQCNICYGQAMLAFLWKDAGASQQEILEGMKVRFAPLLKMRKMSN